MHKLPVVSLVESMQVCEKEMKIKAFSKEGLQAPQKDNPQERAKTEMRDNINKHVEQLETQVWPSACANAHLIGPCADILFACLCAVYILATLDLCCIPP